MMVRIVCTLFFIFCAHNEVAARHSFKETSHVITTGSYDVFTCINLLLSYRDDGCIAHYLSHLCIIHTGWTTIDYLYLARSTHSGCYALCNLAYTTYEFTAMFRIKSAHGAMHLCAFRYDVESSTSLDGTDGDNGRAEWRGFTTDQGL